MDNVTKELCEEKHEAVKESMGDMKQRLNSHSGEIHDIKEAIVKLTVLVDQIGKKSVFDKVLIVAVLIMAITMLFIIAPTVAGQIVGGIAK
jgi:hypothetical protein